MSVPKRVFEINKELNAFFPILIELFKECQIQLIVGTLE